MNIGHLVVHRIQQCQLRPFGGEGSQAYLAHCRPTGHHPHHHPVSSRQHRILCRCFQGGNYRLGSTRRRSPLSKCVWAPSGESTVRIYCSVGARQRAVRGKLLELELKVEFARLIDFGKIFSQGRVNQELGREGILPFSKIWGSNRPFDAPLAGLGLRK